MKYEINYSIRRLRSGMLSILAAASLVLTSCVKEPVEPTFRGGDTEKSVTFSLSLPANSIPSTRALSANDEDAVENIQILAFQGGKYIYTAYCNNISGNQFTVSLREGTYDFVFLANSLDVVEGLSLVSSTTAQSAVLDGLLKSTTAGTGWISDPADNDYQKIPMSSGVIRKTIDDNSPGTPTTVSLYRMLAKIDVEVTSEAHTDFELESVSLYNYNTTGRIFLNTSVYGTLPNLPAVPGNTAVPVVYTDMTTLGEACKGVIYTFEAAAGSNSTLSTNPCLVVGGSYKGGATTYYRIDFTVIENNADNYLPLLRNHRYEVQITNVNGPGFSGETEAFNSRPINIKKDILIVDESLTDITYDGQYMLAFGENDIVLTRELTRSGIEIVSSYDYNSSGIRWTAEVTYPDADAGNDGWLTIFPKSSDQSSSIMTYTAEENETGAPRKAVITVTSGRITKTITITQNPYEYTIYFSYEASNCYMVMPGGDPVMIPLYDNWWSFGDDNVMSGYLLKDDLLKGDLLWTDCKKGLSINSAVHRIIASGEGEEYGYLVVFPGKTAGNAVVTLKTNDDETIRWSWHIWVSEYMPSWPESEKTFMDRNLGALSNSKDVNALGLIYQWGRKDPFPGEADLRVDTEKTVYNASGSIAQIAREAVAVANNLANAFAHPDTYYFRTTTPQDWYTDGSAQNGTLWGANKTVYDPCPAGWKVPASDVLYSMTVDFPWSNYGRTSNISGGGGWYPAAGSRDPSSGGFYGVGKWGYYWSSTASGNKSRDMYFTSDDIITTSLPQRASGYPVRCVADVSNPS